MHGGSAGGAHGHRLWLVSPLGNGDHPDWSGAIALHLLSSSSPCCGITMLAVGDAGTYSRQQTLDNTSPGLRGVDMPQGSQPSGLGPPQWEGKTWFY